MANVHEGLSLGEEVVEPTDDAFTASFLAKLAGEEPAVQPEGTPEEPPAGETQDPPEAGTPETAEGTPTEGAGEAPNEYQIRYEEAQKVIGRQGTELGELRARLEAIEKAQQPELQQGQAITFIPQETAEAIVEANGPEGALLLAINEGVDPDSQAFRVIFDAAAEMTDSQADVAALLRLEMQYRADYGQPEAPATPDTPEGQADPALAYARQMYLESQVQAIGEQIRAANPDFDTLLPHLEKAAEVANLKAQLESGDPAQIQAALATAVLVARGIATQAAAATAAAGGQATDAAAVLRQAAQVATGALRPAVAEGSGSEEDDFEQQFKKAFAEAATPSVADGLSLG